MVAGLAPVGFEVRCLREAAASIVCCLCLCVTRECCLVQSSAREIEVCVWPQSLSRRVCTGTWKFIQSGCLTCSVQSAWMWLQVMGVVWRICIHASAASRCLFACFTGEFASVFTALAAAAEVQRKATEVQREAAEVQRETAVKLQAAADTVLKQHAELSVRPGTFSHAKQASVASILTERGISEAGICALPDLRTFTPPAFEPYAWAASEKETAASDVLRRRLRAAVCTGGIHNCFFDVQGCSSTPLTLSSRSHVLTGVPDVSILFRGLSTDCTTPLASAELYLDWKHRVAFTKRRAQMHRQAICQLVAAAELQEKTSAVVFFTDMCTGFRVWLLRDSKIFTFHSRVYSLSLNDGAALIRYFLSSGLDAFVVSQPAVLPIVDEDASDDAESSSDNEQPPAPRKVAASLHPMTMRSAGGGAGGASVTCAPVATPPTWSNHSSPSDPTASSSNSVIDELEKFRSLVLAVEEKLL